MVAYISCEKRSSPVGNEAEMLHPPGMLTRDQRTVYNRVHWAATSKAFTSSFHRLCFRQMSASSDCHCRTRHNQKRVSEQNSVSISDVRSDERSARALLAQCNLKLLLSADHLQCEYSNTQVPISDLRHGTPAEKASSSASRRNVGSNRTIKLFNLFAAFCILAALQTSRWAEAAPTHRIARARRDMDDSTQKWLNPCGVSTSDTILEGVDAPQVQDTNALQNIYMQAKLAKQQAESFRDDYVKQKFQIDFKRHLSFTWSFKANWTLPSTIDNSKMLGTSVDQDHLDSKVDQIDQTLHDVYQYLVQFGPGLEKIAEDENGPFKDQFQRASEELRAVLCTLYGAMSVRNVNFDDIQEVNLPSQLANHNHGATFLNMRNWIIFRDYMNALEYVLQVFDHLR